MEKQYLAKKEKNAMRNLFVILAILACGTSCCPPSPDTAACRDAILKTERDFEDMVAEKGLAEAFSYYAADSAVLNHRTLIRGREAIEAHYRTMPLRDVSLRWTPDFVDVSASCDLAYTYGRYHFSYRDSLGTLVTDSGIFHTVWKKQPDGSWKYVWD